MDCDRYMSPPSYEAATSLSTTHPFIPKAPPSAPPMIDDGNNEKAASPNFGWNTTLLSTPSTATQPNEVVPVSTLPQSTVTQRYKMPLRQKIYVFVGTIVIYLLIVVGMRSMFR